MKSLLTLFIVSLFTLAGTAQELKVMTYNIRYNNKGDGDNAWPKRKDKVAEIIKRSDVAGLQEVLHVQTEDLDQLLPEYDFIGVGRNNGKTKGEYCTIYYRKDRVEVLENGTFWLSEKPDKVGKKGWDAGITRICTWGKFKDKKSGKEFYVFNTHFDHKGQRARAESARLLIAKMQEIAPGKPVILTGDLNFKQDFEGYATLVAKGNNVELRDAHHVSNSKGEINTSYGFKVANKEGQKIDYIFVSPAWTVDTHTIITDNNGTYYPSDHLPVLATLKL